MNKPYTLQLVALLVEALNNADVRYCHWKGNEHLGRNIAGEGDLDLLIAREDATRAEMIFLDLGFRPYSTVPSKHNNGVMDFLGMDESSCRIVHLHVYFRLAMGDVQLQEYRLPWEQDILNSARPAPGDLPIPIPAPEHEIIILLVRACLQLRWRDRLFRARFRRTLQKDYERNRLWLAPQIDEARLRKVTGAWLDDALWPAVRDAVFSECRPRRILWLRRPVGRLLRSYRTYGASEALVRARLREMRWVFNWINKRRLHWPIPWSRNISRGGAVLCFVGSDGAGKSTMTTEIGRWLGVKLDILPVYMGTGDGSSSLLRKPLILARTLTIDRVRKKARERGKQQSTAEATRQARTGSLLMSVSLILWGIVVALEKRTKLRIIRKAANRGMVVIVDRYPQTQTYGFNDGPLLQEFAESGWGLLRAVARWELAVYELAGANAPDIAVKLMVSPEVAISRKPDMDIDEIVRRNEAVERIAFGKATRVVVISADQPIGEVTAQVKRAVWEMV